MKKYILITALLSLIFSGCAVKYTLKNEFPSTYAYDRLFSAAMLALNETNFGIIDMDREKGTIRAQDDSSVYYDWNAGVFIVLPWISTVDRHPLITVVFVKDGGKTIMSIAGALASPKKNILPSILEKTAALYENPGKTAVLAAEGSSQNILPGPKETMLPAAAQAALLKAEVNWDNNRGVTVRNNDVQEWNDLTISMVYSSMFETKIFKFAAGTLKAGDKVNVKNSLFKDEGNGGVKRNDRPGKILLNCRFEDGQTGSFESR